MYLQIFTTRNYPFQNLSLEFILKVFLRFRKFQPRYSYKIYSYRKKRVYLHKFVRVRNQNGPPNNDAKSENNYRNANRDTNSFLRFFIYWFGFCSATMFSNCQVPIILVSSHFTVTISRIAKRSSSLDFYIARFFLVLLIFVYSYFDFIFLILLSYLLLYWFFSFVLIYTGLL